MKLLTIYLVVFVTGITASALYPSFANTLFAPLDSNPISFFPVHSEQDYTIASVPLSFRTIMTTLTPIPSPAKNPQAEALLAKLQTLSAQSKRDLSSFQESQNISADSIESPKQNPTPFIPIPSLIEGVHVLAKTSDNSIHTGNLDANPQKDVIKIALLGDSMVDTLGKDLPHLRSLLTKFYPDRQFILLNYGHGSTDMENGLVRLTKESRYESEYFPPLLSHKPDIIVIESFAYNHWSSSFDDLNRQWITLARIIDTIKKNTPKSSIILAATIAPDGKTYGDGVLNWPSGKKREWAQTTKAYLQNTVNFATSEQYPLADAYNPSLGADGNGKAEFISQADHLHPSDAGKRLFSEKIVEAIQKYQIIH